MTNPIQLKISRILSVSAAVSLAAVLAVVGTASPAFAFQPIFRSATTSEVIGGELNPEMTYTSGDLQGNLGLTTYVWVDMEMSNYDGVYWTYNTTDFPSCGTSATPSSPGDCGVTSVKVDGVDVPGATAFVGPNGRLTLVLGPSGYTTAGVANITAQMSAGMWTVSPVSRPKRPIELQGLRTSYQTAPAFPRGPDIFLTQVVVFEELTVAFDPNGGSGEIPPATGQGSVTLPPNTITRDGMRFSGWATSQANADEGIVAFADAATIDVSSDLTLFAVWSAESGSALPTTGVSNVWLSLSLAGGIMILGGWMVLARRLARR